MWYGGWDMKVTIGAEFLAAMSPAVRAQMDAIQGHLQLTHAKPTHPLMTEEEIERGRELRDRLLQRDDGGE